MTRRNGRRGKAARLLVRGGSLVRVPARRAEAPVPIGEHGLLLGRDPRCKLVLEDRRVSPIHAELVATPEGVRLRDLGTKGGTFVAGARIVECYLDSACRITCGDSELIFEPSAYEPSVVSEDESFGPLVGRTLSMRQLFERLRQAASSDLSLLIAGEAGSGKTLVAEAVHRASVRSGRPLVVVDCRALPPERAEAALFGHERGALGGVPDARRSPFVEAEGGTLLLDEVGDLPLEVQPKLVRALNERRVKPVGARNYRPTDVRVFATTRRDLVRDVNAGTFRSDLYFRLSQLRVELPPLRARIADVPLLIRAMIRETGGDPDALRVGAANLSRLLRHDWPGNVRELRDAVWTAVSLCSGRDLDIATHVLRAAGGDPDGALAVHLPYHEAKTRTFDRFAAEYFTRLAALTRGNVSEMSRLSGLERVHVRRHLRAYGLLAPGNGQAARRR